MANKKGGRPNALTPDTRTLKTVHGLGKIQATTKECAAVLGVSEPTYLKFKSDHSEVADAYRDGMGQGLESLRRRQFKAAMDGNPTMLVWLGKQYLGQTDKQEIAASVTANVEVTDARSKLEHLVTRQAAAAAIAGSSRKPN